MQAACKCMQMLDPADPTASRRVSATSVVKEFLMFRAFRNLLLVFCTLLPLSLPSFSQQTDVRRDDLYTGFTDSKRPS